MSATDKKKNTFLEEKNGENTTASIQLAFLQEKVLKILFILIWVLAFLHMLAEAYYLYWTIDWFDIVTHFLGGLWLGIASLWFWYLSGYLHKAHMPNKKALYIALGAGIFIGIFWEIYEFTVWHLSGAGLPSNYVSDTIMDICVDFVGACVGYFSFIFFINTKN